MSQAGNISSGQAASSGEPFFAKKIRDAITHVGSSNKMLVELSKQSAFSLLENLLECTNYKDNLMVFVFHMSHLLLRLLLFPDGE